MRLSILIVTGLTFSLLAVAGEAAKKQARQPAAARTYFSSCEFTSKATPDVIKDGVKDIDKVLVADTSFSDCPTLIGTVVGQQRFIFNLSLTNDARCVYTGVISDDVLPLSSKQIISQKVVCEKVSR